MEIFSIVFRTLLFLIIEDFLVTDKLETEIIRVLMLKNSIIKTKIGIPCRDVCNGFPFDFEIEKGLGIYYKN